MSAHRDPELDQLFGDDDDLRALAQSLHAAPHPSARVEPSPHFRMKLRRELMEEAYRLAAAPPPPWYRRLLAPQPVAWAGAAVGALLITFAAYTLVMTPKPANAVQVTSPELNAQEVALVRPIELSFNQPMDHVSVEKALSIQPATSVAWNWQGDTSVQLVPKNQLAPNTQYVVTITTVARTKSGQSLPQTTVVPFTTASPTPTPTPTPSTSPTTAPSLGDRHQFGPVGPAPARWSSDGNALYIINPSGQLAIWQLAGGPGRSLAPDGVSLVAVGPDGDAYARNGQIVYNTVTVPTALPPVAIGFRPGGVIFATASDVENASGAQLATLAESPLAADFSPAGDHLVYRGASGLHMLDLTTRKDTLVGPATALGDWSPDGRRYAYATADGVYTTDTTGAAPSRLAQVAGVTSVAWSHGNQLLLGSPSALSQVNGDGTGFKKLDDGAYAQLQWSPSGNGVFTYRQANTVWSARDLVAVQGGTGQGSSVASQDDLVNQFIDARKTQNTTLLNSLFDQAGLAALARLSLLSLDSPAQARSSVLLSEPGRAVVRFVTSKSNVQTAIDDTLVIQRDPTTGKPLIHGLTETVRPAFGSGPEVRLVIVSSGQVQVFFDSDLDPSTVPAGVTVKGIQTQPATYDASHRMVTLVAPGGFNPGSAYAVEVSSALQDVNQRAAIPYELPFIGSSS